MIKYLFMSTFVHLTGDITYEKAINNAVAAKVIAVIEQGIVEAVATESKVVPSHELSTDEQSTQALKLSAKSLTETFESMGAHDLSQKIAVAGLRAMEERGTDSFTWKAIAEQLKTVGIAIKNPSRELKKAIDRSYIYIVTGQKGVYKHTELLAKAVAHGFASIKQPRIRQIPLSRHQTNSHRKLQITDAVSSLPIEGQFAGLPDYYSLANKSDRVLWLLIYASRNGLTGLNSKEIEWLASVLRDNISATSVPALTLHATKRGYIARNDNLYRSLQKGESYILGRGKKE